MPRQYSELCRVNIHVYELSIFWHILHLYLYHFIIVPRVRNKHIIIIMQTIRSFQRSVDGGVDSNILQRNISIIEAVQIQLVRIETLFSDHESASPVTPRGHCISTSCTALYFKSSRSPVTTGATIWLIHGM